MSIQGRWQVVETPGYDMALADAESSMRLFGEKVLPRLPRL